MAGRFSSVAWPDSQLLSPCNSLVLSEPLRERLRLIREHQLAEHRAGRPQLVCGIFYDQEVVCLRTGGGSAVFLGLDGRIHYENYGEGIDPVVLTDPRDVAWAIVKHAGDIGIPELIDVLPSRLEQAVVCKLCRGNRWETSGSSAADRWCCRLCYGLGWTLA
jgi:hypothetical protein